MRWKNSFHQQLITRSLLYFWRASFLSNTWLFTTTVPTSGFLHYFSKKIDKKKISLDRIMGEKNTLSTGLEGNGAVWKRTCRGHFRKLRFLLWFTQASATLAVSRKIRADSEIQSLIPASNYSHIALVWKSKPSVFDKIIVAEFGAWSVAFWSWGIVTSYAIANSNFWTKYYASRNFFEDQMIDKGTKSVVESSPQLILGG